jgi:NADPH-dependent curcumin reductase CurA
MSAAKARQIVLAARPQGEPRLTDFRLEETAIPTPGAGQVLLQDQYLSLDPYMRGRMDDRESYAPPTPLGGVMPGESVATVVASHHRGYLAGDIVLAHTGWRTHALSDRADLRKLDPAIAPVTTGLGVLGMPGFTGPKTSTRKPPGASSTNRLRYHSARPLRSRSPCALPVLTNQ